METRSPIYYQMVNYIQHDESSSLYGEGLLVNLRQGQYLVRVEARVIFEPGNWYNGPFLNLTDARHYAKYLANLGVSGIRRKSALPRVWSNGSSGNRVEVIRLYRIVNPSPAISSVVAPQRESGTVVARPEHRAAMLAGNIMLAAEYSGQGQQLSLPVKQMSEKHNIKIVERVIGEEINITKP